MRKNHTKGGETGYLPPLLCAAAAPNSTWTSPWATPPPHCSLFVPTGWAGASMLILHRGFMQPAAAGGGLGGGRASAPLEVAAAVQPSPRIRAVPVPACSALQQLPRLAAPPVAPPAPGTLHPTPSWRTPARCLAGAGAAHAPLASRSPSLRRASARTKDCTHRGWGVRCSRGALAPPSRSPCQCQCPRLACRCASLTLKEQQQLRNCPRCVSRVLSPSPQLVAPRLAVAPGTQVPPAVRAAWARRWAACPLRAALRGCAGAGGGARTPPQGHTAGARRSRGRGAAVPGTHSRGIADGASPVAAVGGGVCARPRGGGGGARRAARCICR